jgi:hypothetical protein
VIFADVGLSVDIMAVMLSLFFFSFFDRTHLTFLLFCSDDESLDGLHEELEECKDDEVRFCYL